MHELVRETLYGDLSARRLAELHLRMGGVLEELGRGRSSSRITPVRITPLSVRRLDEAVVKSPQVRSPSCRTGVQTGRSENVPLRARQRPGSSRPVRERRLASCRHHPAGDGEPARSTYSSLSLGPVTVLRSASSKSSPSRWAERELGIAPPTPPLSQRTERRARRRVLGETYRFEPAALSENQVMAVDAIIDNLSRASRSASSDKREATRRESFAPGTAR